MRQNIICIYYKIVMDNVKKKDKGISFFFLLNYLFGFYKQNNMFLIFSIFTWIIKKN